MAVVSMRFPGKWAALFVGGNFHPFRAFGGAPDRTTAIGRIIDDYLKSGLDLPDESVHLLYSANRWEKREEIIRHLEAGTTVVCDRYAFSGVAFTMAKGLGRSWCQRPDEGLPRPDVVLFLELSPEAAAGRAGFGAERYEQSDFQARVAAAYQALRDADTGHLPPWVSVDAEKSPDEVFQTMKALLLDTVRNTENAPIRPLWAPDPSSE